MNEEKKPSDSPAEIIEASGKALGEVLNSAAKAADMVTKSEGVDGHANKTFKTVLVFIIIIVVLVVGSSVLNTSGAGALLVQFLSRYALPPPGQVMPPLGQRVPVFANRRWNPIAHVSADKKYTVSVTGHWSTSEVSQDKHPSVGYEGYDDPSPEIVSGTDREKYWKEHKNLAAPLVEKFKVGALVGQIGANAAFLLVPHQALHWSPEHSGDLYGFINDGDAGNGLDRNQGEMTVIVEESK